jgi:hypothetical protein
MAELSRQTLRRVKRTTEWFIVSQIAKAVPPRERFFLLYEMAGPRSTHPLIAKARRDHPQGRCVDEYILVTVSRGQLETLVASPEWMTKNLDGGPDLAPNEARCIVLSESSPMPAIVILHAHAVNRPGTPVVVDR